MVQVNYCLVKQNVGALIEDSPGDYDRYPDFKEVTGEVVFTPMIAAGQSFQLKGPDGEMYTVPITRIRGKIVEGKIWHEDEEGVPLFAGGENANPSKVSYRVTYANLRAGDEPVQLNPIAFTAIPGATIDLTTVTPISNAPVSGVVKGDKGDVGPAATIVSHEVLSNGDVKVEFSDGTIITIPSPEDGKTPYVKDGNWWIGEHDTGVVADGVDQVRNALTEQISTIEKNAERAEKAAAGTETAISRNASKGQQMIVNGNGQLGGAYWPSSLAVIGDDAPLGAYCSWESSGSQYVVWHDAPVVIDTSAPIYMSAYFRQVAEGVTASVYLAMAPVDQDGMSISASNIMYISGTLTNLARDLNPGDTKVYLESTENWVNTQTGSGYNRRFIIWNHVAEGGKEWGPETYSRNVTSNVWDPGAINYEENSITLRSPWSREFVPKGTPLSNGDNGANYMYARQSSGVGNDWEKIEGTVQGGLDLTGRGLSVSRGWPPGVSAVLPGILINYGANQRISNHRFANVYLSQLSPLGHTHTASDISDIELSENGLSIGGFTLGRDTGMRDVTNLITPSWRGEYSKAYLRRYNENQVELVLRKLTYSAETDDTIISLPSGFAGVSGMSMPRPTLHTSENEMFASHFSKNNTLTAIPPHAKAGVECYSSVVFSTNDRWPTSLPGTPA